MEHIRTVDASLALRCYLGWPDVTTTTWQTAAVELVVNHGALSVESEVQDQAHGPERTEAAYVQDSYAVGRFEPCARVDMLLRRNEKTEFVLTGGVSIIIIPDHVRLLVDGFFQRNIEVSWQRTGFLFRREASF